MHAAVSGARRRRGGGSALLIVRSVDAPIADLTDFFLDRARADLAGDPEATARMVRAAIGRARPYRLVILDSAGQGEDMAGVAATIKSLPGTEGIKVLLLVDQPPSVDRREPSLDAVVPRTVGLSQLVQMVRQLAVIALPDPEDSDPRDNQHLGLVLLVEDDLVSQRLASVMLDELGVRYQIAGNGRAAVAAAQQRKFDLVLMDCLMPGVDGYGATRLLRALPGAISQLPVVGMSAQNSEEDRRRCQDAGMDGFLAKPFDLDQLAGQLRTWLPKVVGPSAQVPIQEDRAASAASARVASDSIMADDPIDDAALAKLANRLPTDRMARLVGTFLGETPKLLDRMTTAGSDGDFEELRLAAHSLKGSSAFLGAAGLSVSAKAVELAAVRQQAAAELIRATTEAFQQVRSALLDRYPNAATV